MAAKFGGSIIGNEEAVGVGRIWRHGVEPAAQPLPDFTAAAQLVSAQANGDGTFTRPRFELEVGQPDFPVWPLLKRQHPHVSPRNRLSTGWLKPSTRRPLKAT